MKNRLMILGSSILLGVLSLQVAACAQQPAGANCTAPNGNRFNLEPRPNALVQTAESVALLPNRAGQKNIDLVVATGTDARGSFENPNATLISPDPFYVQRSNTNCAADFEGGQPSISNAVDLFLAIGSPTVVADPARDAFFIVDLRFGDFTDDNGVGIIHATSSNLLSTAACPNGTELGTASCWTLGAVTNITELNAFLSSPHIAVDPRTSGTGAGNVYTVVTQRSLSNTANTGVFLTACTNGLNCGPSIQISGTDLEADFSWVQVRPDGSITITYRNTTFPGINSEDLKFVNCTPNGAPKAPTCSAPILITTEKQPIFAGSIGDVPMDDELYPRHAHRLEADGKTVTTFLVYDRCDVPIIPQFGAAQPFCPKTDVVMTSSTDGGNTWAPIANVSSSKGQQFFGAIATDASTGTVNIAYYSTEGDTFQQRPQVFLAQIVPGTTTAGAPHRLTSAFADIQASSPLSILDQPVAFGTRIGIAAAGTGIAGQSHAYVTFTWNSVPGTYSDVSSPDVNNHLALFQY